MRGIAAYLVYSHHFFLIFFPSFYFGQHTWVNHFINPDLAVDLFFVHSGFVLAYSGRNLQGKAYYQNLWGQALRRYLRLLPPVLFSIIATYFIMKIGWNFNHEFGASVGSKWLSQYLHFEASFGEALWQSFYGVYFDFKSSTTYNPNLWTIGFELISSYILFVALALFGSKKHSALIFLSFALITGPWKGVMSFMLGASLSRLPKHNTHWALIALLTLIGFLISDFRGAFYESYARSLGAGCLMYGLLQAPRAREFLSLKVFKVLGDLSYSFYALHFLILVSFTSYLGLSFRDNLSLTFILGLYLLTTTALMSGSFFVWKWIDRPGIEFAKKIARLYQARGV